MTEESDDWSIWWSKHLMIEASDDWKMSSDDWKKLSDDWKMWKKLSDDFPIWWLKNLMVEKSDGWRSDDWSLGWLKNLMTEASDDRIQVDWSLTCKHIIQNQSQQHVLRSCVENTLLFQGPQDLRAMQQTGGSGVLPHLQDCLHGERLWHGGLRQRALWGELEALWALGRTRGNSLHY